MGKRVVMGANMLDTYTLVKRLTQAGVPEAQAEAHMSVFLDMSERGLRPRATSRRLANELMISHPISQTWRYAFPEWRCV